MWVVVSSLNKVLLELLQTSSGTCVPCLGFPELVCSER